MNEPPYRNPTLKNLPGEKWKDIPEFEGTYAISNYGRIKSLSRVIVTGKSSVLHLSDDLILRPTIVKYKKENRKTIFGSPTVTLARDGIKYSFTVARLVYILFIEKLDYNDHSWIATLQDKTWNSIHVSNIIKTTKSKSVIEGKRRVKGNDYVSVSEGPITQYNSSGNPIAWYEDIMDAASKTAYTKRVIGMVLEGRMHIYKGCFWRLGRNKRRLNVEQIRLNIEYQSINKQLMDKLKIKHISRKKIPPFLNLSLRSLPGEGWKDFPGYERLYMISNLGRVKALQKVSEGKIKKWKPEQIKCLTVLLRTDRNKKRIPARLIATLSKGGKKKQHSVQRYVYYQFVQKYDLNDPSYVVYYNDANPLNANYKNLFLQKIKRGKKVYRKRGSVQKGKSK